jgi:hypothetical protein
MRNLFKILAEEFIEKIIFINLVIILKKLGY